MLTSRKSAKTIELSVVDGITCANCGAVECYDDPTSPTGKRFNINAFKVADKHGYWWSRCNVCKTWF